MLSYILSAEELHEDSTGKTELIGPGYVQWMTTGAGIVHSEEPGPVFKAKGGLAHGFQSWVNLPARAKFVIPGCQYLPVAEILKAQSVDGLIDVAVIAGTALRRAGRHRHAHADLAAGLAGQAQRIGLV